MAERGQSVRDSIVLGIPFSGLTSVQTLDLLDEMIKQRGRNIIVTANLDFIVRGMKDPILKRIMYGAQLVTPDGMPLVWAGRTMNPALTERVAGSDFIPMLLERAASEGHSVFFLGGREDVVSRAAEQCKRKYSGLKIAGVYSPPFGTVWEMDNADMIARINDASPDIVLVAFGNPKQEYWMAMNFRKLNVPILIGVGGTIDFLSGMIPRAPEWMKLLGAEWLFRVYLEPRRLAKRYAIDIRDGLVPLAFQTATNALLRLLPSSRNNGAREQLKISRFIVKSAANDRVHAVILEECTRDHIAQLASNFEMYAGHQTDALILDLRSLSAIDSEVLANVVAIDRSLRKKAKHCILITGTITNILLRIARVQDILITAANKEAVIERLRFMGKNTLNVVERQAGHNVRILSLHGELTNDSSFILDGIHHVLCGDSPLIFDFTGLQFFDTGGLQHLLDQWNEPRGAEERMHCVLDNKLYSAVLNDRGLRRHFVFHATLAEALASADVSPRQQFMHQKFADSV